MLVAAEHSRVGFSQPHAQSSPLRGGAPGAAGAGAVLAKTVLAETVLAEGGTR